MARYLILLDLIIPIILNYLCRAMCASHRKRGRGRFGRFVISKQCVRLHVCEAS
jgi:hypothetical protein